MRRWLVSAGLAVAVVGVLAAFTRGIGYTARRQAWPLEAPLMRAARSWGTPTAAAERSNPVPPTEGTVRAGLDHWADHCATCHANDGSGDASIGRHLFPPAPDMRGRRTQDLTDGELFYVIEQGLPFTGMPAWGTGTAEGERSSWELVRFIRRLPTLSADELREMEALNPKSAADRRREDEIEEFLSSGNARPEQ